MHPNATPEMPAREQAGLSRRDALKNAGKVGIASAAGIAMLQSQIQAYTGPMSTLNGNATEAFRDILKHERDHVAFIVKTLGTKARPRPTSKNITANSLTQFAMLGAAFCSTGSAAYLGALPSIKSSANVAAAGSLALVEARQVGFIDVFMGKDVTTQSKTMTYNSFEQPLTIAEVNARISPYLASLNGGPPASFTPGDDVSIFNFALLLEYIELDFWEANTAKFVGSDGTSGGIVR